jgi:hypothetical protein
MYAYVYSTDVCRGTIGCTLCRPYQQTYVGPLDVRYFLVNPLDNTWTYETPSGLMYENHRTYARVAGRSLGLSDVCCSVRELVANFLYK